MGLIGGWGGDAALWKKTSLLNYEMYKEIIEYMIVNKLFQATSIDTSPEFPTDIRTISTRRRALEEEETFIAPKLVPHRLPT